MLSRPVTAIDASPTQADSRHPNEIDAAYTSRVVQDDRFGRVRSTLPLIEVLPFCPYVRELIAQNAAIYLDLVRTRDRDRFRLTELVAG